MLGHRQGNTGNIRFLEGISADGRRRNLPGNAHDGRGVHHRRGQAGNHIGSAGARSSHGHPYFASGPGIAIGHMGSPLFVSNQDVVNLRVEVQGVIGGENCPAGIAKYNLYAFTDKTFPNDFRTFFYFCHKSSP